MQVPQSRDCQRPALLDALPLEEGACYLATGKSVEGAYRLARHVADDGLPVVCVSRIHPNRVRAKYGLAAATIWWISESPGDGNFDPTAIGTLSSAIEGFIEDHPDGSLVLLDGIEFIAIHTGFTRALLFVEHLNEFVMPRRTTLLVPVDPECFEPTEFARLDRFTEGIDETELREALDALDLGRDLDPGQTEDPPT